MIASWDDWRDANDDPRWLWGHFTPNEMRCRGSGRLLVNTAFMEKLQSLRIAFGRPIYVLSGYRTPRYNGALSRSKSQTGAHTYGRAVDVRLPDRERDVPEFIELAREHGMTRVGLQLTAAKFRLHIDDMTIEDGFAARDDGRLFCWTY